MEPKDYNKTIPSMEADLEAAKVATSEATAINAKLTDYAAEVAALKETLAKLSEPVPYLDAIPNASKQYEAFVVDIENRAATVTSELANLKRQADECHNAAARITTIESAIAARQKQMSRFGGTLGFNRPFGAVQVILSQDLPLIIYLCQRSLMSTAAPLLPVKAAAMQAKLLERWEQAKTDTARWTAENEVVTYAVRTLRYEHATYGAYETSVLYRTLEHTERSGSIVKRRWVIDGAAKILQLPFEPMEVSRIIRATNSGALLNEWVLAISASGEVADHPRVPHGREMYFE